MSLILKGIDLPKDDSFCMVVGITNAGSDITIFYKDITKGKEHRGIEAIQIPKGHGRLIDADALELEKEVELADDWKTAHEIANCVKYAPTILEEEE